jgi:hypothetical protein
MSLDRILAFLADIGLPVQERPLPASTFLPGILVEQGRLIIDRARLAHPGDLLHEAGHIAVVPPSQRAALSADLHSTPAEEMAAIAWSYAACVHLGLAPEVVFHADGYQGGSSSLLEAFRRGPGPGVPMLQWFGLTRLADDGSGAAVFPHMSGWLRPEPTV